MTQLPVTGTSNRARFFNGSGQDVDVQVTAYPKKDGSGTPRVLLSGSASPYGGNVNGMTLSDDYEKFKVEFTVSGTPKESSHTIDDIAGAIKLADINVYRSADGTSKVVVRASSTADSPYLTTRVQIMNGP